MKARNNTGEHAPDESQRLRLSSRHGGPESALRQRCAKDAPKMGSDLTPDDADERVEGGLALAKVHRRTKARTACSHAEPQRCSSGRSPRASPGALHFCHRHDLPSSTKSPRPQLDWDRLFLIVHAFLPLAPRLHDSTRCEWSESAFLQATTGCDGGGVVWHRPSSPSHMPIAAIINCKHHDSLLNLTGFLTSSPTTDDSPLRPKRDGLRPPKPPPPRVLANRDGAGSPEPVMPIVCLHTACPLARCPSTCQTAAARSSGCKCVVQLCAQLMPMTGRWAWRGLAGLAS